ncbi:MAG: cell division protein FtsL [Acidobacteriota bacterium]
MTEPAIQNNPIRQPDQKGLADALRLIAFFFLLAGPFVLYVALSVHQLQAEYQLSKLVSQRQALVKERDRLRLEKASLLSLKRVSAIAKDKLGMVPEGPLEPSVGGSSDPAVGGR